jgi:AcrR family transcriptional regulator
MATPQTHADESCTKPLRRDAQRNRDALLEAAATLFAEHGLEAPLEQVAKRAGLAIGTLYRHFPTRLDLVQALFTAKLQAWQAAAEQAAALDDAWAGFVRYTEAMCELQAEDRGFNELASVHLPLSPCLAASRSRIFDLGCEIVERAQRQGSMRSDVTAEDLAFVIWSHGRISEATAGIAPDAWRRALHLMLDAFRAERAHPLPVPPLTPDQVGQAMARMGQAGSCAVRSV